MNRQFIDRITQLKSWRGMLFDFAMGAGASLALLPAGIVPMLLLMIVVFWRISIAADRWSAGLRGWMMATGWFSISLYWISHSLFIGDAAFLFMLPISALGLPLFLGLFWGFASFISYSLSANPSIRLIGLGLWLGLAELARGTVLTGFPWNAPGQAFLALDLTAQAGAFVGQYGLNFALFSGISAMALLPNRKWLAFVIGLPVIGLCILSGWRALNAPSLETLLEDRPVVRLVQPNIPQSDKWDKIARFEHIRTLISLSRVHYPLPQLTIWPETAIAGVLPNDSALVRQAAQAAAAFDGMLLLGTLRFDEKDRLYNSALLASGSGEILAITDKLHLVPFGEYVPMRQIPFIDAIAGVTDFEPGSKSVKFDAGIYGQLDILICYEVIFPGFIADRTRPSALINLTNDAWFGQTAGPHQHLYQARARAIEEGLPLMRVANTGISAGIDPYGRIISQIALGTAGFIDVALPRALAPTFYASYRWFGMSFIIVWLTIIGLWVDRRAQNRQIK